MQTIAESDHLRETKIPLINGSGSIPALGFGTLIPSPIDTKTATTAALEAGFRQFDSSERYRNEKEVGEAMREVFKKGEIVREEVFIATKLWNNHHRPERVKPAFEASLKRLQLDYIDLYLIHTPFAFLPGDEQDPRDEKGNVIYDEGVTLLDTWHALESLVDEGRCKAIGLSDVNVEKAKEIFESARIKPAVIHVESIHISRNGSCSNFVAATISCCRLLRRWGIVWRYGSGGVAACFFSFSSYLFDVFTYLRIEFVFQSHRPPSHSYLSTNNLKVYWHKTKRCP